MKIRKLLLAVCLMLIVLSIQPSHSQDAGKPEKYELALVWIADTQPRQYVFVINARVGFKSVAGLKHFVGNLPPGTVLEWDPGCLRMGDEPLLSSKADMDDFKAFCAAKKVTFVLVPSG